jgi:putative aldouronate transport system permease protein
MQLILRNIVLGSDASAATVSSDSSLMSLNIKYAVVFITVLPILVVYPFCQKYFVKGVMVGSVKG